MHLWHHLASLSLPARQFLPPLARTSLMPTAAHPCQCYSFGRCTCLLCCLDHIPGSPVAWPQVSTCTLSLVIAVQLCLLSRAVPHLCCPASCHLPCRYPALCGQAARCITSCVGRCLCDIVMWVGRLFSV